MFDLKFGNYSKVLYYPPFQIPPNIDNTKIVRTNARLYLTMKYDLTREDKPLFLDP